MEKSKTRRELYKKYRHKIRNDIFFNDLFVSKNYDKKKALKDFAKFLPNEYKFFLRELDHCQVKLVEPEIIHHKEHNIDFIREFFKDVEDMKNNKSEIKYLRKHDFSSHKLDREKQFLSHGNRHKSFSGLFFLESGIKKGKVQKLLFAHKEEPKKINIAIDGVAGAGKSTIAKQLAKQLNYRYIDTGLMFRTLTYIAHENKIPYDNAKKIIKIFKEHNVVFRENDVYIDGRDVSLSVRSPSIAKSVSYVATNKIIRTFLKEYQQEIAKGKGIIMDGRDIGSIVLPMAELKLYITADPVIRATRRVEQNKTQGFKVDYKTVLNKIIERDNNDMNRKIAPLVKVEDAIQIDSSYLSVEKIIARIISIVNEKIKILNL